MKLRCIPWILLACSSSVASAEVLEFWSADCPPCRILAPTVAQLKQAGYPIRPVDVAREPQLAARFRVTHVPTIIVVDERGQERGRLVGARPHAELVAWFRRMGVTKERVAPTVRPQSPDPVPPTMLPGPPTTPARHQPAAAVQRSTSRVAVERALAATVRLRVEDAGGYSFGSGTIIDRRQNHLLIVTCGHIFRDSKGRGAITVDLFHPRQASFPGRLVAYEADRADIGFVSIETNLPVEPVAVAGSADQLAVGRSVFSIGCDGGARPTVQWTRITAVDRYDHSPNIEIEGRPVDGRSGGGLFTAKGLLIGVCNAADAQENRGLYASLPLIHGKLDELGLASIYRRSRPAPAAPSTPPPPLPASPNATAAIRGGTDEVICVVRTREGGRRVLVIPRPTAELMDRLEAAAAEPDSTSVARAARPAAIPGVPPRRSSAPVLRAQSPR